MRNIFAEISVSKQNSNETKRIVYMA